MIRSSNKPKRVFQRLRDALFKVKRSVCGLIIFSFITAGSFFVCMADEFDDRIQAMQHEEEKTQETISDLEKKTQDTRAAIEMLEGQKEAAESTVNDLRLQSSTLQSKINEYTDQLTTLEGTIEETESAMSSVSAEIISLNNELDSIRAERDERYALLKNRLKTIYEKGGTRGMLELILESVSFKEVLTRSEFIRAIIDYDQHKMAECKALEEKVRDKLKKVEEREAELDAFQESLDEKYGELENLNNEVHNMLSSTNSSLSYETEKLEDFDEQLAELDATMKSLESQTAAAQAQLAKQIASRLAMQREDTSGSYAASASELEWLAATIQAEADGESYTGKLAVGSVIMNRVKSSAFPNDVVSVITQNMQFASYRSGKVELIISKGPNSTCIKAANEVLGGARVGDYLFFMTKYYADYYRISEYTMIGNHAFFYNWITKEPEETEVPAEENAEDASDNGNKKKKEEPVQKEEQEEEPADKEEASEEEEEEE
ncbi:MAG TPA: hypothetical protein DCL38_10290 [Lachnospiraceae bacterium]|nr:hypothetical protein [Lachnospiraceae bacterium]